MKWLQLLRGKTDISYFLLVQIGEARENEIEKQV